MDSWAPFGAEGGRMDVLIGVGVFLAFAGVVLRIVDWIWAEWED